MLELRFVLTTSRGQSVETTQEESIDCVEGEMHHAVYRKLVELKTAKGRAQTNLPELGKTDNIRITGYKRPGDKQFFPYSMSIYPDGYKHKAASAARSSAAKKASGVAFSDPNAGGVQRSGVRMDSPRRG